MKEEYVMSNIQLKEMWLRDFNALGTSVEHEGQTLRPNTRVSIAIGKVFALEDKGNNNLRLVLKVTGAKYDFTGFINDDNPVSNLLKEAHKNDLPIAVRFEKKRKKNVDPTLDIDELTADANTARDSIVNIVAGVYNFNTETWILTDDAVSTPSEDPEYVVHELQKAQYSTAGFFSDQSAPSKPRVRVQGSPDEKANQLLSMYVHANELNAEEEIGLDANGVRNLAKYLLKAADMLQMSVYGLNEPAYSDYSHTKARMMLFSWLRVNPLNLDIMKNSFNEWLNEFVRVNAETWKWALHESMPEDVSNE